MIPLVIQRHILSYLVATQDLLLVCKAWSIDCFKCFIVPYTGAPTLPLGTRWLTMTSRRAGVSGFEYFLSGYRFPREIATHVASGILYFDAKKSMFNDTAFLAPMVSLVSLNLSSTYMSDIDVVRGMKQLKSLDISNTAIRDLSPIEGLGLQYLNIGNTRVSDFTPISSLASLTALYARNCKVALDMSCLRGLTKLTVIEL